MRDEVKMDKLLFTPGPLTTSRTVKEAMLRDLADEDQGCIITSYRYPADPRFRFEEFYARLSGRGFVIYPGKLTRAACFRIGTIGRLFPKDVEALLAAIGEVLGEMGVESAAAADAVAGE